MSFRLRANQNSTNKDCSQGCEAFVIFNLWRHSANILRWRLSNKAVIGGRGKDCLVPKGHISLRMRQTLGVFVLIPMMSREEIPHTYSRRSTEFRWSGLQSKCNPCPHPLSTIGILSYAIHLWFIIQWRLSASAPTRKPKQKRKKILPPFHKKTLGKRSE